METSRSIFITGTSTGIGRACALRLDREGFQVFAGVRRKADGDALKKASTGKLIPVIVDVTDEKSILKAAKTVFDATGGNLYGLMNNAGVGGGGVLEVTPLEMVREAIETNLIGTFAVTKAFIPMLRNSKGRIVNTASIFGLTAPAGLSGYAASKFGIEGLSESLRVELKPFGISVSVIEPGGISTEIWRKGMETSIKIKSLAKTDIFKLYETYIDNFWKKLPEQKLLPPEAVADSVYHAFTAKKPKRHYLVGNDAKVMAFIERHLPAGIRDSIFYQSMIK